MTYFLLAENECKLQLARVMSKFLRSWLSVMLSRKVIRPAYLLQKLKGPVHLGKYQQLRKRSNFHIP